MSYCIFPFPPNASAESGMVDGAGSKTEVQSTSVQSSPNSAPSLRLPAQTAVTLGTTDEVDDWGE